VKYILGLLEIALRYLDESHAVLNVLLGLVQSADLAAHLFGNREPGRIVAGTVDSRSGRKLLDILSNVDIGYPELAIRDMALMLWLMII